MVEHDQSLQLLKELHKDEVTKMKKQRDSAISSAKGTVETVATGANSARPVKREHASEKERMQTAKYKEV